MSVKVNSLQNKSALSYQMETLNNKTKNPILSHLGITEVQLLKSQTYYAYLNICLSKELICILSKLLLMLKVMC